MSTIPLRPSSYSKSAIADYAATRTAAVSPATTQEPQATIPPTPETDSDVFMSFTLRHNGKGTTLKLRYSVLALFIQLGGVIKTPFAGYRKSIMKVIYTIAREYPKERSTSGLSGFVMDRMLQECFKAGKTLSTYNTIIGILKGE
jgi:hypothetical protein